jgi:hypothetical protein
MDISGDSLVPSRNVAAGGPRGRMPPAQPPTSTRNGRRTRSELEGNINNNPTNNSTITGGYRQDASQGNATVVNNLAFGGLPLTQDTAGLLPLSGQRNEISAYTR